MNGNYKYIALLALFFSCSDSVQVSDTLSERACYLPRLHRYNDTGKYRSAEFLSGESC